MKTKTVKRHYCDHCKKGGQSAYCMRRHESTCIRNPLRVCIICSPQHLDGSLLPTQATVAELIEALRSGGLKALEDRAEMCPACMLAAIVQSYGGRKPDQEDWIDFDYKKQKASWDNEKYDMQRINEF